MRQHNLLRTLKPLVSFLAGIALAANVNADLLVHVDDFEQFSTGTDLSATSYLPALGTTVYTLNDGTGTSTVATNLFGSQGAYIDLAISDGSYPTYSWYTNTLSQTLSNTVASISWNVMIGSTAVPTGYNLYLTAQPPDDFSYFLTIESGVIYAWTNYNDYKNVGTVDPGVLTTNRLDYNLASGTYDYFVNGVQLLGNEPIPADYMTTNFLNSFGFEFYNYDSARTSFFLDNVIVSVPEPSALGLLSIGSVLLVVLRRRS